MAMFAPRNRRYVALRRVSGLRPSLQPRFALLRSEPGERQDWRQSSRSARPRWRHHLQNLVATRSPRLPFSLWLRRDEERSEEHTSELQSLIRISYAGFCLTKKHTTHK